MRGAVLDPQSCDTPAVRDRPARLRDRDDALAEWIVAHDVGSRNQPAATADLSSYHGSE